VDILEGEEEFDKDRVAHCVTGMDAFLPRTLPRILEAKDYANTNFVNIVMDRGYYSKIERVVNEMATTSEVIIKKLLGQQNLAVQRFSTLSIGSKSAPQDFSVLQRTLVI
jgi:hypothetical protein